MSLQDSDDVTICKGPKRGEGCSTIFPRKTCAGLCHRCDTLAQAAEDPATDAVELKRLQGFPQCLHCGKFGQNVTEKCVTCVRQEHDSKTQENADKAKGVQVQAVSGRVSAPRNLVRADAGRHIGVCILPMLNNKLYTRIGLTVKSYQENLAFECMVEDIMKSWASAWDAMHPSSLLRSEIIVFWHGGLNVHEHSTDGTLGEFYNIHAQLRNSEIYLTPPKKYKGIMPDPGVLLTFMIDIDNFNKRTKSRPHSTVTKRRRSGLDDQEPQPKRHAGLESTSLSLASNFMGLRAPHKPAAPATEVELEFLSYEASDGSDMFPWSGERKVKGRLFDDPLQTGKEKVVFELEINGALYVAKRLQIVPTDAASFMKGAAVLHSTLVALFNLNLVLTAFYKAAKSADIDGDVDANIAVQEVFFAAEVIGADGQPSVASGLSAEIFHAAVAEGELLEKSNLVRVFWLIQRRTSNLCERWNVMDSGKFPNAQNKFGTTVAAITHLFANLATRALNPRSRSEIQLLSHFQTVNGKLPNRGFGKVIIDVIFQNDINASEPRRPADIGPQGVKTVLNTHVCNRVCGLLELNENVDDGRDDTSEEADEEEGSDDDT
ncbi:hypothetical protein C8R47DRAFT_1110919 [Mycena vitilis]|nr:hypothetical protein C8R47DRAFT_1110919 [Mycena vitilis]